MAQMCNTMIELGGVMSYPCRLEPGHDGPHEAPEVPRSTLNRNRWAAGEQHDPNLGTRKTTDRPMDSLGSFQSKPQTTGERMAQGATIQEEAQDTAAAEGVGESVPKPAPEPVVPPVVTKVSRIKDAELIRQHAMHRVEEALREAIAVKGSLSLQVMARVAVETLMGEDIIVSNTD